MFKINAILRHDKLLGTPGLLAAMIFLFSLATLSVQLGLISNQQLFLVYKVSYYLGAVAVASGVLAISYRTKCTPAELLGKRYNSYYQSEISAFITFSSVGFIYINSAFVIPYMTASINKVVEFQSHAGKELSEFDEDLHLFMKYVIKAFLEFLIPIFAMSLHKRSEVQISHFTKWVLGISLWYGIWHVCRGFDVVVFKTQIMDEIYAPIGVILNLSVSLIMLAYGFAVTKKAHREF